MFGFENKCYSETFINVRRIKRDPVVNAHRSSPKVPVVPVKFKPNFNFCRKIFGKYSTIKFHENPSLQ